MSLLTSSLERAPRRAVIKSLGLNDDEIEKPLVAIVTADSRPSPAADAIDRTVSAVKAGIYAGGGTPVVVHAPGICAALTTGQGERYVLPTRELVADCVETDLVGHGFDGAVFIPDSDVVAAGMLMGAARVNIPALVLSCGPNAATVCDGKKANLTAVFEAVGKLNSNALGADSLARLENAACQVSGTGSELNTVNALSCVCEALGIALPYNGTSLAGSTDRLKLARRSGEAVCKLIADAVTPRMLMNKRTFINALTLAAAVCAPTDVVLHLFAIAAECNIALDLETLQGVSDKTPVLAALAPFTNFDMQDFALAGGVPAVLHELAKKHIIDGSAQTVAFHALADDYEHAHVLDQNVIHKIDSPISPVGSYAVVKGNLAESGALFNRAACASAPAVVSGKARCFNSIEDAVAAIYDKRVKSGDILVVRYEGAIGAPGMRSMMPVAAALSGMGLSDSVLTVTDGRLGNIRGMAIGHVCPEAAEGGKLALVSDGDAVKFDPAQLKLTLDVPAKTLDARRKKLRPKDSNAAGTLLRYQNLVTSAVTGAVLKKKF